MVELECTVKKWGSSLGIVIPKEIAIKERIKTNETIIIELRKKRTAKDFFGMLSNWKRPTEEIKEEMKKGWK
ncbi:MAG: AbrB/MazE/SpoVT family DNA-binding domain-containing protein [bacterium]|nr:AbrB/MazE/SpoVT family DNA-binding domain-containing protein [bacterium]